MEALEHLPEALQRDVARVQAIPSVETILRVVTQVTGLRFSLVARVTDTQWVACAVHDEIQFGLKPGGQLDVATTYCSRVRDSREPWVVDHVTASPAHRDDLTPKMYGFESYIAVPIFLKDGSYFGNVCALDPQPAMVNQPKVISMMTLFAELISSQLAAEARQDEVQAELLSANEAAELREQFIAVLGHDLRNPLASVNLGADQLLRKNLPEPERRAAERIRASGRRMTGLVTDLLDFARAKLGGGIGLALTEVPDLSVPLRHVVAELESAHPERQIRFDAKVVAPVVCDADRMSQLLSNLLANALEHGAPDRPLQVDVSQTAEALVLSVKNEGPPIPADTLPKLFRPYSRGRGGAREGLGLGLYIVEQIARAHGGSIDVSSTVEQGTRFTFTLPNPRRNTLV